MPVYILLLRQFLKKEKQMAGKKYFVPHLTLSGYVFKHDHVKIFLNFRLRFMN